MHVAVIPLQAKEAQDCKKKKQNCQKLGERHETDCLLKLSKRVEDERDVHEGKDIQPPMADSC